MFYKNVIGLILAAVVLLSACSQADASIYRDPSGTFFSILFLEIEGKLILKTAYNIQHLGKCEHGHGVKYCAGTYLCECNQGTTFCNQKRGLCGVPQNATILM
jgi:hypothetical protein